MPKYLAKGQRHVFFVTNQNAKVKDDYLIIPKLGFKLKLTPHLNYSKSSF
ncbi:hypothetical protein LHEJCM1006_16680 [Lactobacillus helveticus]|nr:hypothetical protein LHEJCM1006_16680 [Lactobacillus helveticus]GIP67827.1 hypothetical protein LhelvAHU1049_20320 [Lactobacillus helveticus]